MKVQNCPKKLGSCPGSSCPLYPCWAYEAFMESGEKERETRDRGWE